MTFSSDVLIVGAGPAGLSLATALAHAGLRSTVLDQQPLEQLQNPAPDGREIALTHPSVATLERLGHWQGLVPHEIGSIREAHVHDGPLGWRPEMQLNALRTGLQALGFIVPNHALRRVAYAAAAQEPLVRIVSGARVTRVATLPAQAEVEYTLTDEPSHAPERLTAALVVAADSRFSAARRQLGIGARMTDFGRTVIVCRMEHHQPHGEVAHECFGHERTLAILPLPDDPVTGAHLCSVVVTTSADDAARLMEQDAPGFTAQVQAQFADRLGTMALVGERFAYPLVAVYANRFTGHRCALVGDAAVGMHPVTAHGYNLGLSGVERLTQALATVRQRGGDLGSASALAAYGRAQHLHALPIYEGTNAVVRLFTDARPVPRLLRQLVLQGASRLPPLKARIVAQLTGRTPRVSGSNVF